ncbi:MAG: hypothetical protein CMQ34_12830 [Gammaproteobacteria bacterium]|nr:hypothetical protein [Gammaproteobacteria bacterium]
MLLILSVSAAGSDRLPALDASQASWVADRIFQNECNRQLSCLTSWNVGEDFPSLGIGHFIWYRQGQQERFVESFPDLLGYYVARGVDLPDWIAGLPEWASPWPDRETFLADVDSDRMQGLREFLSDTRGIQADFIVQRLERSLPDLMAASAQPDTVAATFYRVAHSEVPHGMYALIDYVNFKGEGTALSERYNDQGWGLLQVLEAMQALPPTGTVLQQFAAAARHVLAQRIENAPAARGEERWRQGWNNRTLTYVP